MVGTTSSGARPAWRRFLDNLTAVAQAAEIDGFTYHDRKIARLERRIAALEGAAATRRNSPDPEL